MKLLFSIGLFLLLTIIVHCQHIQVLEEIVAYDPSVRPSEFQYLDAQLDSLKSMKIATVKAIFMLSENDALLKLFAELKEFAHDYGANSFRIDSKRINYNKLSSVFIASIYATSPSYLEENKQLHPLSMICIFGTQDYYKGKPQKVKINKEAFYIKPFEYFVYRICEGETVRLNRGGTIKLTGSPSQKSVFYAIGDGAVKPDWNMFYISSMSVGMGVKFTKGKLLQIYHDYGYFLTEILKPIKEPAYRTNTN